MVLCRHGGKLTYCFMTCFTFIFADKTSRTNRLSQTDYHKENHIHNWKTSFNKGKRGKKKNKATCRVNGTHFYSDFGICYLRKWNNTDANFSVLISCFLTIFSVSFFCLKSSVSNSRDILRGRSWTVLVICCQTNRTFHLLTIPLVLGLEEY